MTRFSHSPVKIAVLVSGHSRGTNLQSLIDASKAMQIAASVELVVGTREDSPAISRANAEGIKTAICKPKDFQGDSDAYGKSLNSLFAFHSIDIVCLLGYLFQLPSCVVSAFPNRILNVHPALLPFFGGKGMYGMHVHQAVLDSGMKVSGCTVHLVDENYDTGPILVQICVPVDDSDTVQTLAVRVLDAEHLAIVNAVKILTEYNLSIIGSRVFKEKTTV